MTPHENVEMYWVGERPERIPFTIYGAFCDLRNPEWVPLFERGLVPTYWVSTITKSARDVEKVTDTYEENGHTVRRTTLKTPVGEIYRTGLVSHQAVLYWPRKYWLSSAQRHIAEAPIDHIESLTEPPEGDMTLAECRAVWPEKGIWSNINVGQFDLPADRLRAGIRRKIEEGAPDGRGLALEISEDLPVKWQQGIPAILEELGY